MTSSSPKLEMFRDGPDYFLVVPPLETEDDVKQLAYSIKSPEGLEITYYTGQTRRQVRLNLAKDVFFEKPIKTSLTQATIDQIFEPLLNSELGKGIAEQLSRFRACRDLRTRLESLADSDAAVRYIQSDELTQLEQKFSAADVRVSHLIARIDERKKANEDMHWRERDTKFPKPNNADLAATIGTLQDWLTQLTTQLDGVEHELQAKYHELFAKNQSAIQSCIPEKYRTFEHLNAVIKEGSKIPVWVRPEIGVTPDAMHMTMRYSHLIMLHKYHQLMCEVDFRVSDDLYGAIAEASGAIAEFQKASPEMRQKLQSDVDRLKEKLERAMDALKEAQREGRRLVAVVFESEMSDADRELCERIRQRTLREEAVQLGDELMLV